VPLITNLVCAPTRSSDFVKTPQYLGLAYSIVPSSRKLWVCPLLSHPPASASSIAKRHLRCSCRSYVRLVFSIPSTSSVRLLLFASFASTVPSSLYLRRTPMFVTALSCSMFWLCLSGLCLSGLCLSWLAFSPRLTYHPNSLPALGCHNPLANIVTPPLTTPSVELSVNIPIQNHPAVPLTSYKLLYHGFSIMCGLRSIPTVPIRCVGLYDNCLASLSIPLCSAALLAVSLQLLYYINIDDHPDCRYVNTNA
jgi:hypothetical protein